MPFLFLTRQVSSALFGCRSLYFYFAINTTHRQEDKLVVPKTVVFPYEKGDAVWVVREGKAAIQTVTKGLETGTDVVIEEGLQPGDRVIINPKLEGLKEGKKVAG